MLVVRERGRGPGMPPEWACLMFTNVGGWEAGRHRQAGRRAGTGSPGPVQSQPLCLLGGGWPACCAVLGRQLSVCCIAIPPACSQVLATGCIRHRARGRTLCLM